MLDSTIAGNGLLVCSSVEKSDVERIPAAPYGREEDCIGVSLGIVIILAVAGETAQEHPMIFVIPLVQRQENEPLVESPGIRKAGHEGIVHHIPALPVILLLYVQNLEDCRSGLTDGEISELGIDVRNRNAMGFTHGLDLVNDFLNHILVVVIPCQ